MATKAWRRTSLRWPPTPEQWQGLQQDLDYVYRWIRDLQANGGGGGGGTADLSNLDADNLTSGTVPAARMPALTGDVTSSVGTVATTLAASGVSAGTYGDSTHVPQVTVDEKGRVTAASNVALQSTSAFNASGYRSTNQTLTHNTLTAISFDTEHYDNGGLADFGTNATRLTCPTGGDGIYTVKGQIALGTGFTGTALLQIAKNGTVVASNTYVGADLASGTEYHDLTADVNLAAGDYVEFKVTLVLAAGSGTFAVVGGTANTLFQAALASPQTQNSYGGAVLLETHTASGVATLDFTTRNGTGQSGATVQSDYDEYLIELVNLTLSTTAQPFLRFTTNGGTSWDSSAIYDMQLGYATPGSAGETHSTGDTKFPLRETTITLSSNGSINMSLRLFNPGGAIDKNLIGHLIWNDNSAGLVIANLGCVYKNTTAVNGVRLGTSTGTFSGTMRIYGLRKS